MGKMQLLSMAGTKGQRHSGPEHTMSAYIVDNQTINNVLSQIELQQYQSDGNHLINHVKDQWGFDLSKKSGLQTLGQALRIINYKAVNARYKESELPAGFDFKLNLDASLPVAIKSLHCLKYQCSEGNIPDEPVFKCLEYIEHSFLTRFVRQSPAYESAPWG